MSDLQQWNILPLVVKVGGYGLDSWDNTSSARLGLPASCADMMSISLPCWPLMSDASDLSFILADFFPAHA